MAHEEGLRVGVVCGGTSLPAWETRCIAALLGVPRVDVVLVVLLFRDQWNVGIVDAPIHAFLSPRFRPAIRWLPTPARHRFLPDPFGLPSTEGTCMLAEEYDYRARLGRIVAIESRNGTVPGPPRLAIDLPGHASYPCTVVHRGEVYCIPETYLAREVSLFRGEARMTRWIKVRTLIDDFPALDPTVFEYGGRWWLFCGDGDAWPHGWSPRTVVVERKTRAV